MGFFAWVVFGAIAGWAANLVVGGRDRRRQGCLVSVLVGVVGAALGGLLHRLLTGREMTFEFDFPSLGVAALGAVVLLAVLRAVQGRPTRRGRR
ncbi:Transglycosylase-associated protein [Actinokineospora spheciospongiae]|uniref:Transglycosylase-associated protein n=1 Tax=Actinokineospora spheciospongiae TaxID=909613 RepID=W7IFL7_9PSEU|nr:MULTISPECIES: GlsB/YeaQ/YmgE family stress response membrane protein [Actinokineospora]EWC59670.1 Transglycosylase-associated protein [Actinokineospora spheciospongiae]MCG8916711.1 GlsB/YeaQ/YmgE family stress response membrane protein [Actinokineospora sp. PR83]PWW65779.1 putative membrane protein YeaQ/YmgE (transglycosylase-associated protein family) [Actinokineospora spheciospongiae]